MKVGFIGLGSMGLPMAQRIQSEGHDLTLFARRPSSLEPFAGTEVSIVATPAEMGVAVDVVGVPLLIGAGYYASASMYVFYGAFTLVGFFVWARERRRAGRPGVPVLDIASP